MMMGASEQSVRDREDGNGGGLYNTRKVLDRMST